MAENGSTAEWRRVVYDITGVVQGIGFRPAIYRLARAAGLGGSVQNRSGVVRLELTGEAAALATLVAALPGELPPGARIDRLVCVLDERLPHPPETAFTISASGADEGTEILIPADLALCADCGREIFDPSSRRFGYAFTTCTQCGPRYTVVHGVPYDRERTTLATFPLCGACRAEYTDPANRRFHAESIACADCGPQLWLEDARGQRLRGDPLRQARAELASGAIVAVRGLGGFLLAVDVRQRAAIEALRRRKRRPHKPFAVMARELATVRRVCACDGAAGRLLSSAQAPIVILDWLPGGDHDLPLDLLAPDTRTLGVMLPTTPLQALLASPLSGDPTPIFDWLVMTSGNRGGEPICLSNDEARARLAGIADLFLLHDRDIHLRCDDSIAVIRRGAPQVWRRARGFAPAVIRLAQPLRRTVLAMGAELKNALAIGYGDRIAVSPHIGDLEAPEAVDGLRQAMAALPAFVQRQPEVVAVDAHPDMHASRLGREWAAVAGVPVQTVQHHHAHAAACLAEHGVDEALALVFDGMGLGTDGHIWGAELLALSGSGFRRLASFAGVPLPGGDAAVRHPVRQVAGRCHAAGIDLPPIWRARLGVEDDAWRVWMQQCAAGVHAPVTHAAGRLLDAFAVLLGLAPKDVTYEGQPAICLEAAARLAAPRDIAPSVPYRRVEQDGMLWIDWSDALRELLHRAPPDLWEARNWADAVQRAIVNAALEMVGFAASVTAWRTVALSGGVFMNRYLTETLADRLERQGLRALLHRQTPPNDGGVAIGQAAVIGRRDA